MDSEIFFLSVNFKIKQNCLTRGVYSDGKPGCLTRPVCNFPSASALAPETTPPGRGTFSKPPFTGPRPGALISLSASVGPGKRGEEGVQRKKCTQRAGEGPHSVPAPGCSSDVAGGKRIQLHTVSDLKYSFNLRETSGGDGGSTENAQPRGRPNRVPWLSAPLPAACHRAPERSAHAGLSRSGPGPAAPQPRADPARRRRPPVRRGGGLAAAARERSPRWHSCPRAVYVT
ncbi:uncharacterized protein LOC100525229 [Sus scrofa]|uniref:uncharacterized protein LOC100525229 n=1 Tax=Sus scrofa TaxID=9823 RepID=UPI000A2B2053|nr:uncharacterized protein LOC100525229 [Sus scrofa]XP_020951832.1 uncharacterized protein LOC100525229 [Sus scrofa]XP_020951834.1 uncharacterized protein LOC100525229 [Sus scrofa]XP_020951835.1 uncharacterized protein LOC100525229 [Sus scrofa]